MVKLDFVHIDCYLVNLEQIDYLDCTGHYLDYNWVGSSEGFDFDRMKEHYLESLA